MVLILIVYFDKPYGNSNLVRKISSKIIEDFFPKPFIGTYKYLSHLINFLEYCNENEVPGFIYHRVCTTPNKKVIDLLIKGGHKLGLHAENTRSYETFIEEYTTLKSKVNNLPIDSFSKHGSGNIKLGKFHYPNYEPENYLNWSKKSGVNYFFGNDICKNEQDLDQKDGFFPNIFWIERDYRHPDFFELEKLINAAKKKDVVVLIHPCNYDSTLDVKEDFKRLVNLAKNEGVEWKVY